MGLAYSQSDIMPRDIDFIDVARQAISRDCRKTFIGAIRDQQHLEISQYGKVYFTECPSEYVSLIFQHRAINCATGMLKGEARFNIMDLNFAWIDGLPPLHLAARNLSYGLTQLFMLHGADPNLCCHGHGHGDDANIPLCFALEALRCNPCVTEWDVKKSPFKLIYILCLKELREAMNTIRLLASRTENLHKISLQYAEEGEVLQLTALLLLAWDKLVTPYATQGVEFCPIGQCIYKELELLSDVPMTGQCSFRKSKLECSWKMLNILDKSHYRIEDFLYLTEDAEIPNYDVPKKVCYMIHGVVEEFDPDKDLFCDDVPCLAPILKPEEADELRQNLEMLMRSGPLAPPAAVICENYISNIRAAASHSFHTWSKPKFTKDLMKVHKLPTYHPLLPNVRMCALLFSIAKRSIK